MNKLTMKTNDCFQGFYLNGKRFWGRKQNDDLCEFLTKLGTIGPYEFEYAGELSYDDMERDFG